MKRFTEITKAVVGSMVTVCLVTAMTFALVNPPAAHAEQYTVETLTLSTNAVAANATNTASAAVITCTKYDEVALQFTSVLAGAGTDNIVLKFATSADGSNYDSDAISWTFPAAGTTTNTVVTNIVVNSIGYLKLTTVGNGAAEALSVISAKSAKKPMRTGQSE